MRFLIDANLSPKVRTALTEAGFEATHVADVDLANASDEAVFDWAARHEHIVVAADSDFGTLLAFSRATSPSILQLRGVAELRPDVHVQLLLSNLRSVADVLLSGAIVTISPDRIRTRELPIER